MVLAPGADCSTGTTLEGVLYLQPRNADPLDDAARNMAHFEETCIPSSLFCSLLFGAGGSHESLKCRIACNVSIRHSSRTCREGRSGFGCRSRTGE
jgi:hypothetical protein